MRGSLTPKGSLGMVSESRPQLVDLGFALLPRLGLSKRIRAARASPNSSQALTPRAAPPAWLQKLGENPAFLSKSGSARSRASSPVININRDDADQFQLGCRGAMLSLGMGNYVNFVDYPFMCSLSRGRAARCRRWVVWLRLPARCPAGILRRSFMLQFLIRRGGGGDPRHGLRKGKARPRELSDLPC